MSDEQTQSTDDNETLKHELETCKKQCEEYLNGWKRAKADYINYKNETEKRRDELAGMALMTSAAQFIPPLDNLKIAFIQLPDELKESDWVRGIEQIRKQLVEIMKGLGVEEFAEPVVGAAFDPAKFYAVGEERRDDFEDGVITQEVSPGYTFRGSLMVPAKVIVNKNQESRIKNQESEGDTEKNDLNS
ncbi:nucleotide exchange factor GrpE [Candidatus Uhrbacteria bacterium]|nr:nucleotide exchange factor GrpE [Candidatus Uhrbacteria bacterium]